MPDEQQESTQQAERPIELEDLAAEAEATGGQMPGPGFVPGPNPSTKGYLTDFEIRRSGR